MTLVIVATAGSADANSFVTEAEAIDYAATRLNLVGWATVAGITATENEKRAMIEATRELNFLRYKGYRATSTQALNWPRVYAINEEDAPFNELLWIADQGYPLYYTDIPQRLKEATIELAFEFLRAGTTDISRLDTTAGIIRKKVDVLETEWEPGATSAYTGLARFPRVTNLISPLLADSGAGVVRS